MEWRISPVTPPEVEPVSGTDDVEPHIRLDIDDDNKYIDGLIRDARLYLEQIVTSRSWLRQTWRMTLDRWPDRRFIRLPRPPLIDVDVDGVTYVDADDAVHVLSPDDYIVDTSLTPGRIVLRHGASWPSVHLRESGAITIEYAAGYGDDPDDVPGDLKRALLLLVGSWYEQREDYVIARTAQTVTRVPFAVDALTASYVVRSEYP